MIAVLYFIWIITYTGLGSWFVLHLLLFKKGVFFNQFLLVFFSWSLLPHPADLVICLELLLKLFLPASALNLGLYCFVLPQEQVSVVRKYRAKLPLENGNLVLENIRRGVSIIGAAGSGKTESVVYNLLKHFRKYSFSGLLHDYKNFELTEIAYPLFKSGKLPFYIISFDRIYHRVNPIAPKYMIDEESVNEVARVLLENLLEQKELLASGTTKFFNDAVEGLIGGMIWKLKTDHPQYCTLPHLIAVYQSMDTPELVSFLSGNITSRSMADAFISGIASERQTAAVKSSLANALKKICTQRIFMALSKDEVPLDINNPENPAIVSIVNNPKFETAYSPVITTTIHTITKQMSIRQRGASFLLMEEAPTLRLLHMHRVPATLRSYNISTIYVMQDKIQNDLLYGEKASKAILSNLSYQFFGKVNDPDTAKYYEQFFEIIQKESISIHQGGNLNFDTRITRSHRDSTNIRFDAFFRLKAGEFVSFADGKEKKIRFAPPRIKKELPGKFGGYSEEEIRENYYRIFQEVQDEILNK
ncbi:type IV secretory system conjugative DNA transfer family protein [Salinimicrobium sp. WS361]|uniref:type IV secretory system conjugative DNA transfer family protein n=1 Tax=Salinimicrobium sp. WS361 TaxID=3425123 RepID=UPI003D6FB363